MTSAPRLRSPAMLECATRLCTMSPTNRDLAAANVAELFAHRVEIEQRLRRMRVTAVAGVDDVPVENQRDAARKSGLRMPHDDHVHAHRGERDCRVLDRLAFAQTRLARPNRDDVGAQAFLRERERGHRARALLEEHVDARDAVEEPAAAARVRNRRCAAKMYSISSALRSSRSMRLRLVRNDSDLVVFRRMRPSTLTATRSRRLVGMKRPT